jgi:hypothetical protein
MLLLQAKTISLQIELQLGHVSRPIHNHTHVIYKKNLSLWLEMDKIGFRVP